MAEKFYAKGRGNGQFVFTHQLPIDRQGYVVASITEIAIQPDGLGFPFIGAARMSIHNIAPRDDGIVQFWVNIEWDQPLDFWINGFYDKHP